MDTMTKLYPFSISKEISYLVRPVQRQVLGENMVITSTYFLTAPTNHYPRVATKPG